MAPFEGSTSVTAVHQVCVSCRCVVTSWFFRAVAICSFLLPPSFPVLRSCSPYLQHLPRRPNWHVYLCLWCSWHHVPILCMLSYSLDARFALCVYDKHFATLLCPVVSDFLFVAVTLLVGLWVCVVRGALAAPCRFCTHTHRSTRGVRARRRYGASSDTEQCQVHPLTP